MDLYQIFVVLGLVVLVLVDGRGVQKGSWQERRERFLQRFLNGSANNFVQFSHVQQRLDRHRNRLAQENRTVSPDEEKIANIIQQIHKQDQVGEVEFVGISKLNDAIKEFLFEGDILLTEDQAKELINDDNNNRTKRQASTGPSFPRNQWPVGQPIPYVFTSSISSANRALIRQALQFWTENTCLSFAENGSGQNRLYFNKGSGCYSYVGRIFSQSEQEVSIGDGCDLFGIVAHEIGHALGFFHTMSRYDRDSYVSIQYRVEQKK